MPFPRKNHLDPLAIAILLACCILWGAQQVLVKATVAEVAPVFQAFVRFAIALAAIMAWCLWRGARRAAGRGAVCQRIRLHLHRPAIHHGLAADGVSVLLAVLGGAAAAALRAR